MHKRGLCRHAVSVCLSVSVSVTFVSCVKTNKHIFKKFSPSSSQAILVFLYQTSWQYSDGNPPNGSVECKWGRQKSNRDFEPISDFTAAVNAATAARCCQHVAVTSCDTTAGSKAASVVVHGRRRRNVYDKKSQRFAEDNRTFNCTQ